MFSMSVSASVSMASVFETDDQFENDCRCQNEKNDMPAMNSVFKLSKLPLLLLLQ